MESLNIFVMIVALFVGDCNHIYGQQPNDLYLVRSQNDYSEKYGYINVLGDTVIPFGKYTKCYTDTFKTIAFVYKAGCDGIIAINKQEQKLFQVYFYDNGPDYISEGLFRIIENDKIGFANMKGEIVIRPTFSSAFPFSESYSAYCIGCRKVKKGEYTMSVGGKWGFIDKTGKMIIQPRFDQALPFKEGRAKVTIGDDVFYINKNGQRVE